MTTERTLMRLDGALASVPHRRMAGPVSMEIAAGRHTALVGRNGSGKTTLLQLLTGGFTLREGTFRTYFSKPAYKAVRTVSFNGAYSVTGAPYYYQQRWQSQERDLCPTAGELLARQEADSDEWRSEIYRILKVEELLDRSIITLSSGELRRYHICKALLSAPEVMILESPFMGLDPSGRKLLTQLMETVAGSFGITFIISVTSVSEVPEMFTALYLIENMSVRQATREEAAAIDLADTPAPVLPAPARAFPEAECVAEFRGMDLSYGSRRLFSGFSWKVLRGESWNVTGENGSGKSTLLNLVCGDNPRAYSLDMSLFGRKRGTGESIWDIKRHIGYLSPEMHSSFISGAPVESVVASGLSDTFSLPSALSPEQRRTALGWMEAFGIAGLEGRIFRELSSGEQRLVLLVRTFVKDPDVLILDEPYQGLDRRNRSVSAKVIEAFMARPGKTLLFVTHYPEELPRCVGRTLRLGQESL